MPTNKRTILMIAGILFAMAVLVFTFFSMRDPDEGKLRVTVLDVGQGDCILVETPDRHTLLIDGGGANGSAEVDPKNVGIKTIIPYLHYRGINELDLVVLTHPHSDHVGGLVSVIDEVKVDNVLDGTVLDYTEASYDAFKKAVRLHKIPYRHAARGMHIDFGDGAIVDVLNPPVSGTPYGTEPSDAVVNNYSTVFRLTYGRTHFLFDGDAETDAEQLMVNSHLDVSADVLKCGHHGANNATSDVWLDHVHPQYAAISCGLHNPFHHPGLETLDRLKAHNVRIFRTDQDGAIIFVSDGEKVSASKTIQQ